MIKKLLQLCFVLSFSIILCGCVAEGENFRPAKLTDNNAVIYVYRSDPSYCGSAVVLKIDVDGKRIGGLKPGGYLQQIVAPGEHKVSCKTECESSVIVDVQSNQSVYVASEVVMGFWVGRPKLTVVPEITGKGGISGTKNSL